MATNGRLARGLLNEEWSSLENRTKGTRFVRPREVVGLVTRGRYTCCAVYGSCVVPGSTFIQTIYYLNRVVSLNVIYRIDRVMTWFYRSSLYRWTLCLSSSALLRSDATHCYKRKCVTSMFYSTRSVGDVCTSCFVCYPQKFITRLIVISGLLLLCGLYPWLSSFSLSNRPLFCGIVCVLARTGPMGSRVGYSFPISFASDQG